MHDCCDHGTYLTIVPAAFVAFSGVAVHCTVLSISRLTLEDPRTKG